MSVIEKKLKDRSGSVCEISGTEHDLVVYTLPPHTAESLEHSVLVAKHLKDQIENPETMNENDWRGLSESMWNEHLPVQILSWRMLARLKNNDLLKFPFERRDCGFQKPNVFYVSFRANMGHAPKNVVLSVGKNTRE